MPCGKKPVPVVLLFKGCDFDGGDEWRVPVNIGVTFGEGTHGGQVKRSASALAHRNSRASESQS